MDMTNLNRPKKASGGAKRLADCKNKFLSIFNFNFIRMRGDSLSAIVQ